MIFIINGIIAILFGLLAVFTPHESLVTLARWFGLIFLIGGVAIIYFSTRVKGNDRRSALLLTQGIVAGLAGLVLLIFTRQSLTFFMILIGIWALAIGLLQLFMVISYKGGRSDKKLLIINGLISVVFGVVLILNPWESLKAFTIFAGLIAFIIGALLVYSGIRIRLVKPENP